MKDILLITPPFTQLNTPYPATAYIKGFLNLKGITSFQLDLGIEVVLQLFSDQQLMTIFTNYGKNAKSENAKRIFSLKKEYCSTIASVIRFLQGKNPSLARHIVSRNFLPEASRFNNTQDLEWAFGNMGIQDAAKHLATLYLEDISDFIKECVDENFGFTRYAEKLGRSANNFNELYEKLVDVPTYIDFLAWQILEKKIKEFQPKLVCFSIPFPGNLYSAFRNADFIKKGFPSIKIAIGGGFPNTELREIKEPKVFQFIDFITLDDGELPLELLFSYCKNNGSGELKRTYTLEHNKVVYQNNSSKLDYKMNELASPDYSDLILDSYLSVIELANPMQSIWSDGRWNKLTMAHGCYWGKCTFCDITLDYIKIYEPVAAKLIVDRMEELLLKTGENGFHFVDEAAPPSLMKEVALEICKRKLVVSWWTNIRFEKSFTKDLCVLLKKSGCIAVSGGLEVASDRLLRLIDKGVTVAQVAQVTHNFTSSGIMVHAYLMYGYPTQTIQETIDSLEMVRQLFEVGVIKSGFWHQFAMTAHAPIGLNPEKYGVIAHKKDITFANNDIEFTDSTGINHQKFNDGLNKSLFNFMQGIGFDKGLQFWFDFKIPKTTIAPKFILQQIQQKLETLPKDSSRIIWVGGEPETKEIKIEKKGNIYKLLSLQFHFQKETVIIQLEIDQANWLVKKLNEISYFENEKTSFKKLKESYEAEFENFELFWFSKPISKLKHKGILVL